MRARTDRKGKTQFQVWLNTTAIRGIQSYARNNGLYPCDVLKNEIDSFENDVIAKYTEINNEQKKALLEEIRNIENQRIIDENPMKVSGHEEDPIGNSEVVQPTPQ